MADYNKIRRPSEPHDIAHSRLHVAVFLGDARRCHVLPDKVQAALKEVLVLLPPPLADILVVQVWIVAWVAISPTVKDTAVKRFTAVEDLREVIVVWLKVWWLIVLRGLEDLVSHTESEVALLMSVGSRRVQVPIVSDEVSFLETLVESVVLLFGK